MTILDIIQRSPGISPKRISRRNARHHGPEYASACPFCGGRDRFHVWPDANHGRGKFWCRGCRKSGDIITLVMLTSGCTFMQACRELGIEIPEKYLKAQRERNALTPSQRKRAKAEAAARRRCFFAVSPATRSESAGPGQHGMDLSSPGPSSPIPASAPDPWLLCRYQEPPALWKKKAAALAGFAAKKLREEKTALAYLAKRGISFQAAEAAGLGWNPKTVFQPRASWGLSEGRNEKTGRPKAVWIPRGIVIPVPGPDGLPWRIKIRRDPKDVAKDRPRPDGKPLKYFALPGASAIPLGLFLERPAVAVTEAELDAACLASALPGVVGALGIGSLGIRPDIELFRLLASRKEILLVLDNEETEEMERTISSWKQLLDNLTVCPVPRGKDPGEAFEQGVDIPSWLRSVLCPALQIAADEILEPPRTAKALEIRLQKGAKCLSAPAKKEKGGGGLEKEVPEKGPGKGSSPGAVPPAVLELRELMEALEAHIIKEGAALTIIEGSRAETGASWEAARRLSHLVFMEHSSWRWLMGLPDGRITPQNILKKEQNQP